MRHRSFLLAAAGIAMLLAIVIHGQSPQEPSSARLRFPKDNPEESMFLLLFGAKTGNPEDWSGEVSVSGGTLEDIRGYRFDREDKITPPNRWTVAKRIKMKRPPVEGLAVQNVPPPAAGVVLTLLAPPGCEVSVSTTRGNFRFKPGEIETGAPRNPVSDAQIIRLPVV